MNDAMDAQSTATMITPEVQSSRRGERIRRRRRQRTTTPPCRGGCLALCCLGVLLLSSSNKERRRSGGAITVVGVCASDYQSSPPTASHRSAASSSPSRSFRFSLPTLRRGFPEDDDDDMDAGSSSSSSFFLGGVGREFDLFDTRGGVAPDDAGGSNGGGGSEYYASSPLSPISSYHPRPHVSSSSSSQPPPFPSSSNVPPSINRVGGRAYSSSSPSNRRRRQGSRSSSSGGGASWYGSASSNSNSQRSGGAATSGFHRTIVEPVQNWWSAHVSPNVKSWPKLSCRVEPTTTLKIRKTFRPIGTIVRLGADFNTQLGAWQFKSSWEDAFLGGKLTLAGRELQLTKSWQLSVTAVEDLVTRLRCRAAVDLQTWKAYVRVGFRTERLSPINVVEGFTILKQIPLDGTKGHVKLEVKAILSLPEPEIEYSTETQRSLVGMGDIEVNVEELNLLLDY